MPPFTDIVCGSVINAQEYLFFCTAIKYLQIVFSKLKYAFVVKLKPHNLTKIVLWVCSKIVLGVFYFCATT